MNDFDMQQYVMETLKPLDVPVYYVARKEAKLPLVVFNVTHEKSHSYWDDEETAIKYNVMINIFSRGNFVPIKNKIVELMKANGFKRYAITECIYQEDLEIYNQPLEFSYIKESYSDGSEE